MATTKVGGNIYASTTLTAGAAETTLGSLTTTTDYGVSASLFITNGATGPTLPAFVKLQVSNDNTNWATLAGPFYAGTTAATTYDFTITVPKEYQYIRVRGGGNTAQNVTSLATYSRVTGV